MCLEAFHCGLAITDRAAYLKVREFGLVSTAGAPVSEGLNGNRKVVRDFVWCEQLFHVDNSICVLNVS